MAPDIWWTLFGWLGSAVVVFSLLQTKIVWLRTFNLIGCLLAVVYNVPLAIWPSVGLNAVISVVNIVQLVRLRRERTRTGDPAGAHAAPLIIEVLPGDGLFRSIIAARRAEVEHRAGRPLARLLAEATAARIVFDGDRLSGCAVHVDGAELVVYGDVPERTAPTA